MPMSNPKPMPLPNIFTYSNYREFLKEYYVTQKAVDSKFSFRYLSQRAGINSSAFYKNILEGKRNLTKTTLLQTCVALKLKDKDAEYFENLVFFNQAKTIKQKNIYFDKMTQIRGVYEQKKVSEDQYAFYSEWYHSAIRELIDCLKFKGDFKILADQMTPKISEKQAEESLALLMRLGMAKKNSQGRWQQSEPVLTTGGQVSSKLVVDFQKKMLRLAETAFDEARSSERLMSSTTFGISEASFELFRKKICDLKAELLDLARLDENPTRVFQLNLNFFPLSKSVNK